MPDAHRRPTAAELMALEVDDWSALLAVALPVVRDLPDLHRDATVRRVAPLPPGRLVTGRSRRDLARVLTREPVWGLVEQALSPDAARPWDREPDAEPSGDGDGGASDREVARLEQQVAHLRGREHDLVEKVGQLRTEVDRLRREHDGALARAEAAATAQAAAEATRDEAAARAAAAQQELAAVDDRVRTEVARARRREDGETAQLRDQLRAVRRERDELRRELAAVRERAATPVSSTARPKPAPPPDDSAGRRGRPSRLPDGVVAGTRDAAQWLVAEGRLLLVDGYNVTRTHRPHLPLADQRRWLEGAVTALAQRRSVDATIVWDSAHGTATTRRSRGGLTVRFTPQGVSADDELVLHVELAVGPDTPVVAVTDDVELRGRLAQHGVDLLDSQSFTWLL